MAGSDVVCCTRGDAVQNNLGGFFIGYDTAGSERLLVFASGRLVKEKHNEL